MDFSRTGSFYQRVWDYPITHSLASKQANDLDVPYIGHYCFAII